MNKKIIFIVALIIVLVLVYFTTRTSNKDETMGDKIPTSADNAPPGSIHNLPVPDAVAAVRTLLAGELGIDEGVVIILTAFKKEWRNSCLELEGEDEFCLQVITPGYEVTVQAEGTQFIYRTNESGTVIHLEK